jgi:hypothetical protein
MRNKNQKIIQILLTTLMMMLGNHAFADNHTLKGSEAINLVIKANKKGLILNKHVALEFITLRLILDGKYYSCFFTNNDQSCSDFTEK